MGYGQPLHAQNKIIVHYFGRDDVYLGFSVRRAKVVPLLRALFSAWLRGATHVAIFNKAE